VVTLVVVFAVVVVAVRVRVVATVVAVVVAGGALVEVVDGPVGVDELEVDFEPPQPPTTSTPKRTASPLTFAG
jgi:hypothetical protein